MGLPMDAFISDDYGNGVKLPAGTAINENRMPVRNTDTCLNQAQPHNDARDVLNAKIKEIRDLKLEHSRQIKSRDAQIEELQAEVAQLTTRLADGSGDSDSEEDYRQAIIESLDAENEQLKMQLEVAKETGADYYKKHNQELSKQIQMLIQGKQADAERYEQDKKESRQGHAATIDDLFTQFRLLRFGEVAEDRKAKLGEDLAAAKEAAGPAEEVAEPRKAGPQVNEVNEWDEGKGEYVKKVVVFE